MTIKEALEHTKRLKRRLGNSRKDKDISNTIDTLTEIICWYDKNQKNLIKALLKQQKENKNLMMEIDIIHEFEGGGSDDSA